MLAFVILLSALPLASSSIDIPSTCASAGAPRDAQGGSTAIYIDTGVTGDVIFVQADASILTIAGDCSLDFDAERARNVVNSSNGCCEIGLPVGSDLDLFVNGEVRRVFLSALSLGTRKHMLPIQLSGFAANPRHLRVGNVSLRTDGAASLVSNASLSIGSLDVFANGKSRLALLSDDSSIDSVQAKADGMSDVAVFGNMSSVSVDLLNGFARMFLGAVQDSVKVVLMDGASQLRVEGAPGSKIVGKQLGAANDIKTVNGECSGPPRCSKVALTADFWPAWNDPELVG